MAIRLLAPSSLCGNFDVFICFAGAGFGCYFVDFIFIFLVVL